MSTETSLITETSIYLEKKRKNYAESDVATDEVNNKKPLGKYKNLTFYESKK